MSQFDNILYEERGPLALVTINRESRRNAISLGTLEDLHAALELAENNDTIRCFAITGAGDKSFASGSDLSEVEHRDLLVCSRIAGLGVIGDLSPERVGGDPPVPDVGRQRFFGATRLPK